jgi:hypothetical protein
MARSVGGPPLNKKTDFLKLLIVSFLVLQGLTLSGKTGLPVLRPTAQGISAGFNPSADTDCTGFATQGSLVCLRRAASE